MFWSLIPFNPFAPVAIHYLKNNEIDYSKWDRCIDSALNGSVYARTWFLDIVTDHWNALIEDDYLSVFPLVYQTHYFRNVIYMPELIKHLGVFSSRPVSGEKILQFLKAIPPEFKRVHICFNKHNSQLIKQLPGSERPVFELDLIIPAEKRYSSYSERVNSILSSARQNKLAVMKNTSLYEFEKLLDRKAYRRRLTELQKMHRIILHLMRKNQAEIIGAYGPENMICAAACFIRSHHNVILFIARSDHFGEISQAGYLILDTFLKKYSARNITLSFDYQDKTWNKRLFTDFGAQESHYFCYRNRQKL